LEGIEKEADTAGKSESKFAWVMDRSKAERERGLTIDSTMRHFEAEKQHIHLVNMPGHRDFSKNFFCGACHGDVILMVLSAVEGDFERDFSKEAQVREHTFLSHVAGIKQVRVVINKMDLTDPPYSEDRFAYIEGKIRDFLKVAGFKSDEFIPVVPVSGWHGDNLLEKSPKMLWYKGASVLDSLERIKENRRSADKSLRLPIFNVVNVKGVGAVALGRIQRGVINPGMRIWVEPGGIEGTVSSLHVNSKPAEQGIGGDYVGFQLEGDAMASIRKGQIASDAENEPVRTVKYFTAQVIITNTQFKLKDGFCPLIHVHNARVPCEFFRIKEKRDRKTGRKLEDFPAFVKRGDACIVRMRPKRPLCVETIYQCGPLGRFIIRDLGMTIAFGIVQDVEYVPEQTVEEALEVLESSEEEEEEDDLVVEKDPAKVESIELDAVKALEEARAELAMAEKYDDPQRVELAKANIAVAESEVKRAELAATRIQAMQRGKLARAEMLAKKESKEIPPEEGPPEEGAAAVTAAAAAPLGEAAAAVPAEAPP